MVGAGLTDPTGKKLMLNTAYTFISYLFSMLTIMYVSRVLQPEGLGSVTFAASVISYFTLFAGVGIPNYGFRTCAENRTNPQRLSYVTRELVLLGLIFAAFACVALVGSVCFIPAFRQQKLLYLLLGSGIFFSILRCDWFFCATEAWKYRAVSSLIIRIVALVLTVFLVRGREDLLLYAALTLTVPMLSALSNQFLIHRKLVTGVNMSLKPFRHLGASLRFLMMSCVVNIYSQLDIVMLGFMSSSAVVGYYGIASQIKAVLTAACGIIWHVNLPTAVKCLSEKDHSAFQRITIRSMRLVMLVQIPIFAFSMIFAGGIVGFISGPEYAPAVLPLRILLLALPPIAVSGILGGQVLIPAGQEKQLLRSEIAGAVVNLVLNALLIPLYSMSGAAAATVAAEIVVCGMTIFYTKKNFPICFIEPRFILIILLLTAVSSCAAIAFSGLLKELISMNSLIELLLTGGCFGAVFAGLCLLWRSNRLPYALSCITTPKKARKLYCPCCGKHFKKFKSGNFRDEPLYFNSERYKNTPQDVLCPFCGALPRHRIIACWAEQNAQLLRKSKILYFAPETSMMSWFKKNEVHVTTADLFAKADLRIDITEIALPDQSCDVVFCSHVLEHVSDYKQALRELHRILRPGGTLVICFPMDPSLATVFEKPAATSAERLALFGQYDHLRVFGADSAEVLAEAGFSVSTIDISKISDSVRPCIGPADYDSNIIYVCSGI